MVNRLRLVMLMSVSFIVASFLMLLPISYQWQWLVPQWLALVLIYWIFAFPQVAGTLTGWCVGLGFDILKGGLLGQYALSLLIVAYLARLLRNRSRLYPFWHQAFVIAVLVGFGDWVLLLAQWLIGYPPRTLLYWVPTLSSVLVWPLAYRFLKLCEQKILG